MLNLICLLALAAAPATDDSVSVVVFYDQSEACRDMAPILAELKKEGRTVLWTDATSEANKPWIERFKIDVKNLPFISVSRGHAAFENHSGPMGKTELAAWFARADIGQRSNAPGIARSSWQDWLGKEDRPYLRYRDLGPSCGMSWCISHSHIIATEEVWPDGRVQRVR